MRNVVWALTKGWRILSDDYGILVVDGLSRAVARFRKDAEGEKYSQVVSALPAIVKALSDARIALTFYRGQMTSDVPGKSYPHGIDSEKAAREVLDKLAAVLGV